MKKFYNQTNKNEKKYYSLNFLLSDSLRYRKIKNVKKNKSIDLLHDNLDQKNYYFYKPISKILKKY